MTRGNVSGTGNSAVSDHVDREGENNLGNEREIGLVQRTANTFSQTSEIKLTFSLSSSKTKNPVSMQRAFATTWSYLKLSINSFT